METTNNQPDHVPANEQNDNQKFVRKQRKNQLVFVEYEEPTEAGHKITVVDSYRNILGRIYEKYDTERNRFEYTFCNHEGKPQFIKEDLQQLKDQIMKNKTILIEHAHERRLEMKNRRGLIKEPISVAPFGFRKKAKEKTQEQKQTQKKTEVQQKNRQEQEREAQLRLDREQKLRELEGLRDNKEQNRELEISQ